MVKKINLLKKASRLEPKKATINFLSRVERILNENKCAL